MTPLNFLQSIIHRLDRLLARFFVEPFRHLRSSKSRRKHPETDQDAVLPNPAIRPLHEFQKEAVDLFSRPCDVDRMKYMSSCLKADYQKKLKSSTACMLPSFCYTLPTGQEVGNFIALDLGGSTFRVAIVELTSRSSKDGGMHIRHITVHKIHEQVRQFSGNDFLAWMAGKIYDTLYQCTHVAVPVGETMSVGLAWSFPIAQTSYQSGTVLPMGKGFKAHEGIVGQDLGKLIELACRNKGLKVRVNAIVNDSSATLLSQAYKDPTTTIGLILGTGTNAAVYLPVTSLGTHKLSTRTSSCFKEAQKVIVNTEVSMFGKGIFPETRWDEQLNNAHTLPNFQPLEYMTTGRYLGEILRLVVAEAVETCNMFGGIMPDNIQETYSLDTALLAAIEEDTTMSCISSAERLQKEFGLLSLPSSAEMAFLRAVIESISHRASAYIAVALHALWSLEHNSGTEKTTTTCVSANGSVISLYPGFRSRCQQYVARLIDSDMSSQSVTSRHELVIQATEEATILGVAVAVALIDTT